jgi:hypothetical protein
VAISNRIFHLPHFANVDITKPIGAFENTLVDIVEKSGIFGGCKGNPDGRRSFG